MPSWMHKFLLSSKPKRELFECKFSAYKWHSVISCNLEVKSLQKIFLHAPCQPVVALLLDCGPIRSELQVPHKNWQPPTRIFKTQWLPKFFQILPRISGLAKIGRGCFPPCTPSSASYTCAFCEMKLVIIGNMTELFFNMLMYVYDQASIEVHSANKSMWQLFLKKVCLKLFILMLSLWQFILWQWLWQQISLTTPKKKFRKMVQPQKETILSLHTLCIL